MSEAMIKFRFEMDMAHKSQNIKTIRIKNMHDQHDFNKSEILEKANKVQNYKITFFSQYPDCYFLVFEMNTKWVFQWSAK